ncbi:MAG: hypothetical protein ASARMPREDX12_000592 [Alectoria sarmentosa]|nr:MAG: hypothetical protein ASARMPREDX12_000592 [Alectoria sarmentosa]
MEVLCAICILGHFCANVFAAPPLTPPSLSLVNGLNVNLTAPFSLTQPFLPNRLPPDPFHYLVPDSDETVRFYDYGIPLPRKDVFDVLVRAAREIAAHGSSNIPIPDKMIRYGTGNVFILVHQSGRMTWKVWETAVQGIADFVERYECVDMDFDIGQTGSERFFGTGVLGMMKREER